MKQRTGLRIDPFPGFRCWLERRAANPLRSHADRVAAILLIVGIIVAGFLGRALGLPASYTSEAQLLGIPVLAWGDVPVAWIAVGAIPIGVVAIGGLSVGLVAIGGVAVGLFSWGGLAIAALIASGGVGIGFYALGGLSIGAYAFAGGGVAYGYFVAQGRQRERLWVS
jgi:hypothetical protein